jgi:hypothetical protein
MSGIGSGSGHIPNDLKHTRVESRESKDKETAPSRTNKGPLGRLKVPVKASGAKLSAVLDQIAKIAYDIFR